ncbi:hypothetical protein WA158_003398 [Blastocystis sp. Blastoise]
MEDDSNITPTDNMTSPEPKTKKSGKSFNRFRAQLNPNFAKAYNIQVDDNEATHNETKEEKETVSSPPPDQEKPIKHAKKVPSRFLKNLNPKFFGINDENTQKESETSEDKPKESTPTAKSLPAVSPGFFKDMVKDVIDVDIDIKPNVSSEKSVSDNSSHIVDSKLSNIHNETKGMEIDEGLEAISENSPSNLEESKHISDKNSNTINSFEVPSSHPSFPLVSPPPIPESISTTQITMEIENENPKESMIIEEDQNINNSMNTMTSSISNNNKNNIEESKIMNNKQKQIEVPKEPLLAPKITEGFTEFSKPNSFNIPEFVEGEDIKPKRELIDPIDTTIYPHRRFNSNNNKNNNHYDKTNAPQKIQELYPSYSDLEATINANDWKQKVPVFEEFGFYIKDHPKVFENDSEAVLIYIGMASKDYKIANAFILKCAFEVASVVMKYCAPSASACHPAIIQAISKLTDRKNSSAACCLLLSAAESITPNTVISTLITESMKMKAPTHHKSVFALLKTLTEDFGAMNIDLKNIMDYTKGQYGLGNSNPDCKNAAIDLLAAIHIQIGDVLRTLVQQANLNEYLLKTVMESFDKNPYDPELAKKYRVTPSVSTGKSNNSDENTNIPVTNLMSNLIQKEDISKYMDDICKDIQCNKSGPGWKTRLVGVENYITLLQQHPYIENNKTVASTMPILKKLLKDTNLNLRVKTLTCIAALARAIGEDIRKYNPILIPEMLSLFDASKNNIITELTKALDSWVDFPSDDNMNSLLPYLGASLANKTNKGLSVAWMVKHRDKLTGNIDVLFPCLLKIAPDLGTLPKDAYMELYGILYARYGTEKIERHLSAMKVADKNYLRSYINNMYKKEDEKKASMPKNESVEKTPEPVKESLKEPAKALKEPAKKEPIKETIKESIKEPIKNSIKEPSRDSVNASKSHLKPRSSMSGSRYSAIPRTSASIGITRQSIPTFSNSLTKNTIPKSGSYTTSLSSNDSNDFLINGNEIESKVFLSLNSRDLSDGALLEDMKDFVNNKLYTILCGKKESDKTKAIEIFIQCVTSEPNHVYTHFKLILRYAALRACTCEAPNTISKVNEFLNILADMTSKDHYGNVYTRLEGNIKSVLKMADSSDYCADILSLLPSTNRPFSLFALQTLYTAIQEEGYKVIGEQGISTIMQYLDDTDIACRSIAMEITDVCFNTVNTPPEAFLALAKSPTDKVRQYLEKKYVLNNSTNSNTSFTQSGSMDKIPAGQTNSLTQSTTVSNIVSPSHSHGNSSIFQDQTNKEHIDVPAGTLQLLSKEMDRSILINDSPIKNDILVYDENSLGSEILISLRNLMAVCTKTLHKPDIRTIYVHEFDEGIKTLTLIMNLFYPSSSSTTVYNAQDINSFISRGDQITLLLIQLYDTCLGNPIQIEHVDEELCGFILNVIFFIFYENSQYKQISSSLSVDTLYSLVRILTKDLFEDHEDRYVDKERDLNRSVRDVKEARKKRRVLYQRILILIVQSCPLDHISLALCQYIKYRFIDITNPSTYSKTISNLMKRLAERVQRTNGNAWSGLEIDTILSSMLSLSKSPIPADIKHELAALIHTIQIYITTMPPETAAVAFGANSFANSRMILEDDASDPQSNSTKRPHTDESTGKQKPFMMNKFADELDVMIVNHLSAPSSKEVIGEYGNADIIDNPNIVKNTSTTTTTNNNNNNNNATTTTTTNNNNNATTSTSTTSTTNATITENKIPSTNVNSVYSIPPFTSSQINNIPPTRPAISSMPVISGLSNDISSTKQISTSQSILTMMQKLEKFRINQSDSDNKQQ